MAQPKITKEAIDTGSSANKIVATDGTGNVSLSGNVSVTGTLTSVSGIISPIPAVHSYFLFGQNITSTTGLTLGYYGGVLVVDGVQTVIANGTVGPLTASTTNYVESTRAGVVSFNTTGFTAGQIPLFTVVTDVSSITSVTDNRPITFNNAGYTSLSVAGGSNVTLTAAQARNDTIIFTGELTANIDVIIPDAPKNYTFVNNTTGAYTLRVKTSGGTGYYVMQGKAQQLYSNGTNVLRNDTEVNNFDGKYGWQDLRGSILGSHLGQGSNSPTWTVLQNGVYGYTFAESGTNEAWINFHLPHDYVPGTEIHVHVHWLPTNTNTGVTRWGFEYTLAKGYSQAVFPSTSTIYLEQAASGTALTHQIIETTVGNGIPSTNLEPDVIIMARVFRDGSHVNDTYYASAFCVEFDLHYQSTLDRTTKNKNFPFF